MKAVLREILAWLSAVIFALPGKLGQGARVIWGRQFLGALGDGARLAQGVFFDMPKQISFGRDCQVGRGCFFSADGGKIILHTGVRLNQNVHVNASVGGQITLGNNCLIGPNVVFRTASHNFDNPDLPINSQGHTTGDIVLEDDVWIAANAVILSGVTIGHGSVVAAGSVVTKSIPPMTIVAGVPARKKRTRGDIK